MSFEGHRLNDMIDLVERANPADLESAGQALKKARDAIAVAARELGEHIDRVDWEGEAGRSFRKWGKKLVKETHQLSDFADAAGVQIAAAGAGLASVRSSMPPRDTRADPKAVEDIPSPKRMDGNADYEGALRAEKHRQEAINQMNRLASFYKVSQHEMAGQEPPTFSAMPDVGVPRPAIAGDPFRGGGQETAAPTSVTGAPRVAPSGQFADNARADYADSVDGPFPHGNEAPSSIVPREPVAPQDRPIGTAMVIDSVGTLPPQTTGPVAGPSPSVPGPTAPVMGPVPLLGSGPVKRPVSGPGPGAHTPGRGSGAKPPVPAPGKPGLAGPGVRESTGGPGRSPSGQAGHTSPVAQGRSANGPTAPVQSPVGRGITGGTPQFRGVPGPRPAVPGITGAPRADGVTGGRPVTGPMAGPTGSRVPRGVVGAAPSGTGDGSRIPRRPVSNSDGVLGTPKERTAAGGGGRNGFTTGGAGLARGPAGNHRRSDQEKDAVAQQPDYLVEDEETHLPGGRRHVPPVID